MVRAVKDWEAAAATGLEAVGSGEMGWELVGKG